MKKQLDHKIRLDLKMCLIVILKKCARSEKHHQYLKSFTSNLKVVIFKSDTEILEKVDEIVKSHIGLKKLW